MSRLIKAGAGAGAAADLVRLFGAAPPAEEAAEPSRETLLEARIAELEAVMAKAEERHLKDLELAREKAAESALEQRSAAEERSLQLLADAGAEANRAWKERLKSWEPLSIAIARAVLEQVFADASERSALLESSIRRRIASIGAAAMVRLKVSAEDFASPDLLRAAAGNEVEILLDPALGSGQCLVELKLGEVDLGLDAQWGRIAELLRALEGEG